MVMLKLIVIVPSPCESARAQFPRLALLGANCWRLKPKLETWQVGAVLSDLTSQRRGAIRQLTTLPDGR